MERDDKICSVCINAGKMANKIKGSIDKNAWMNSKYW